MRGRDYSDKIISLSATMRDTAPKAPLQMDTELNPIQSNSVIAALHPDRRRNLRIDEHFPIKVRGVDAEGEEFYTNTELENLSASGLYMRLNRKVGPGERLFAILTLAVPSDNERSSGRVAVRGLVQRVEAGEDGLYGIAMRFTRYRFL